MVLMHRRVNAHTEANMYMRNSIKCETSENMMPCLLANHERSHHGAGSARFPTRFQWMTVFTESYLPLCLVHCDLCSVVMAGHRTNPPPHAIA